MANGRSEIDVIGSDGLTPVSTSNPLPTQAAIGSSASLGASVARIKSAATTNITVVKASPGNVSAIVLVNNSAAKKFVKLYNKATAPVLATDVPVFTLILQPNVSLTSDALIGFSLGISYAITNLVADTDATVVAADDVNGFIAFK